jgi:Trypsin-co-occurring domain 1
MDFGDEERTEKILVALEDGNSIYIEVAQVGKEDVGFESKSFKTVADSIESIVKAVATPIRKVSPHKANVKFGLEIGIEQGSLVASIVRGTGKANLEISLEWSREDKQ